jgi:GNAT superfamily N-acetyltransferase
VNSGKWRDRTESGDHGLLLEHGGDLVGYTWASERWFLGIDNRPLFELAAGEAYLFDTYVENAYRGSGIAGLLRELMCERLASAGRDTFYSFTLVINKSARRFKEKLAASPVELRVRVRLFGRWFADGRLRQWRPRIPVGFRAGRLRRRRRPQ